MPDRPAVETRPDIALRVDCGTVRIVVRSGVVAVRDRAVVRLLIFVVLD